MGDGEGWGRPTKSGCAFRVRGLGKINEKAALVRKAFVKTNEERVSFKG